MKRTAASMIVDAHTHIYPESVAPRALGTVVSNIGNRLTPCTDGTYGGLMSSMDTAGVDFSIVLMIATHPGQGRPILQWIKDRIPSSPRLIFFGSVHPRDPQALGLVRETAKAGIQGIKFHPPYQGFPVDSRDVYPVYEEASKQGLAMYFHAGPDPSVPGCDYADVKRFAAMLKDFEGSKMILAHGGGYGQWDKVLDMLGGTSCFFDVAFVLESMGRREDAWELYRQTDDRFIFGTDSPWRDQKRYVDMVRNTRRLTRDQKEKLFYKNIRKIVRIPEPCSRKKGEYVRTGLQTRPSV